MFRFIVRSRELYAKLVAVMRTGGVSGDVIVNFVILGPIKDVD